MKSLDVNQCFPSEFSQYPNFFSVAGFPIVPVDPPSRESTDDWPLCFPWYGNKELQWAYKVQCSSG